MARTSPQLTAVLAIGGMLLTGGAWAQTVPGGGQPVGGNTQTTFGPCAPIQYQFGQEGGTQYTFPSGPPASTNPPQGGKGLGRESGANANQACAGRASDADLLAAMIQCLSAKLSYFRSPTLVPIGDPMPSGGGAAAVLRAVYYSPPYLDRQSLETRTFQLSGAMADEVLSQRDAVYGASQDYDYTVAKDEIVGFLDHCMMAKGLVPTPPNGSPLNPSLLYLQFLGSTPADSQRVDDFYRGFSYWPSVVPRSLLAPK